MALTPFLAKLANHGLSDVPPSDRIKLDINNKGLVVTNNVKQGFTSSEISRRRDAKQATEFKYCITKIQRFIQGFCYRAESMTHNTGAQGPIIRILLLTIQRPFFSDLFTKNYIVR